jgi:putative FmdB family regulatory protein
MPQYSYSCQECEFEMEVTCKMSEMEKFVPTCPRHGDMKRNIVNNNKHVDHTEYRKGFYNSKETQWR